MAEPGRYSIDPAEAWGIAMKRNAELEAVNIAQYCVREMRDEPDWQEKWCRLLNAVYMAGWVAGIRAEREKKRRKRESRL